MNRPLVFLTPAFILGILFSSLAGLNPIISLIFLSAAAASFFIFKNDSIIFVMFFFLGAACFSMSNNYIPLNHISRIDMKNVKAVTGSISEMPRESGERIYFILSLKSAESGGDTYSGLCGRVRVSAEKKTGGVFRYGDIVRVEGKLKKPGAPLNPGEFDYGKYLSNRGISGIMYVRDHNISIRDGKDGNPFVMMSLAVKDRLLRTIYNSVPRSEARILDGIMLGNQRAIPSDIYDKFKITGTVHILAVSGMNVGLIALFIFLILKILRVKRKIAAAVTMLFTAVFAVITGADPSIVRAAIMAWIVLAAVIIERDPDIINSLAAAALIILLIRPSDLFEAGFQLSFLATFGLIYLTSWAEQYRGRMPQAVAVIVITTITAQVFLMPVLANTFNQVSVISVLANIIIVPVSGMITILGFVMWICGFFSMAAAKIFGASIWALIKLMLFFIDILAKIPYAAVSVRELPFLYLCLYYAFFLVLPHDDIDIKLRNVSVKAVSGAVLLALTVIHLAVPAGAGRYYVMAGRDLNSAFIHTRSNKKILFIGCDNYRNDFAVRSKVIPFLRHEGINNIDYLIGYSIKNRNNMENIRRNFMVFNEINTDESMNVSVDDNTVMFVDPVKTEVSGSTDSFIFTKLLTSDIDAEKGKIIYPCFYSRKNLLAAAKNNKVFINSMNRIRPVKAENSNVIDTAKAGMCSGAF